MKKLYCVLALCCLGLSAYAQGGAKAKLSPYTKKYLIDIKKMEAEGKLPDGYIYKKHADNKVYLAALIKVSDAAMANAGLSSLGCHVGTRAGNIWTVQVPLDKVQAFTQVAGIAYIQTDEPVFPNLNMARKTTRVDSVHGGYGLPMPYSGKDVVMGIIDFGFDYNHPTMYDTLGTTYRIKKVWELNTTGTPPSGYSYGHELADTNAIKAQGTDNPRQTHGTGVAGIAAGSGYGSLTNNKFRGMAYDAEMVLVGVRRDSIETQWMTSGFSDFLDGVNYIFQYANGVGKPAVVNISWGSQSGPHDGTSLFNQACDNLSGAGKIIVMSAGNEGDTRLHLKKNFTTTDTAISTALWFSAPNYKRTWVDIWGDTAQTFCVNVTLYSNGVAGNTTGTVCIDDQTHSFYLLGANNADTCFVDLITASSEFNDKPRVTASIFNKAADSVAITVSGTDGYVDMWDEYYYYGYQYGYYSEFDSLGFSWAVGGNTQSTVSDMGSAESVLLVGAYASKVTYTDINSNSWSYSGYVPANKLVPFSSRGPMADGRIKPDITAPGLTLATAVSSFDTAYTPTGSNSQQVVSAYTDQQNHTYYYSEFSGTSASSPAAAGIVALLLQADPTLTPQQVKDVLFATAIQDVHTGALPSTGTNNWGHGKINAYAALKDILQISGVYSFSGSRKLDVVLFPNPGNGNFTVDYTTAQREDVDVTVTSLTGMVVYSTTWQMEQGQNQKQLNLGNVAKGVYAVSLNSRQGSATIKTIVK